MSNIRSLIKVANSADQIIFMYKFSFCINWILAVAFVCAININSVHIAPVETKICSSFDLQSQSVKKLVDEVAFLSDMMRNTIQSEIGPVIEWLSPCDILFTYRNAGSSRLGDKVGTFATITDDRKSLPNDRRKCPGVDSLLYRYNLHPAFNTIKKYMKIDLVEFHLFDHKKSGDSPLRELLIIFPNTTTVVFSECEVNVYDIVELIRPAHLKFVKCTFTHGVKHLAQLNAKITIDNPADYNILLAAGADVTKS